MLTPTRCDLPLATASPAPYSHWMKMPAPSLLAFLVVTPAAHAQVVPANPTKFKTRSIGGNTGGDVRVTPRDDGPDMRRFVTYLVLADSRTWTSADGKPVTGKLIAFEDLVVEVPAGSAEPPQPALPEHPTVVRAGKARLLVNNKPFEIPLARLSAPDREFIEAIRAARAKPPADP